ncbi:hypothetical protein GW17_00044471 [Ensete ventricosum]|nr:hypothetical protein GW17_00044471 [Ensete ventricosum]
MTILHTGLFGDGRGDPERPLRRPNRQPTWSLGLTWLPPKCCRGRPSDVGLDESDQPIGTTKSHKDEGQHASLKVGPKDDLLSPIPTKVQPQVLYPHPRMAFATFSSAVRDPFLIASLGRPDPKRKKEEEKSIKDRSEPAAEALVRSHCRAPAHVVAARCDEKGRRETS